MKQGETAAFFVKCLETRRIKLTTDEEACVCAFESKLPQEFLWDVEVLRRSRGAGVEAEWSMFVAVAEDRLSGASITVNESVGAAPAATGVSTAVSYPPPPLKLLTRPVTESVPSTGRRPHGPCAICTELGE